MTHRAPYLLLTGLLCLSAVLSLAGCDSAKDEPTDAERMQGEWLLTGADAGDEDLTPYLSILLVRVRMEASRSFSFIVRQGLTGTPSEVLKGVYNVEPLMKTLIFRAEVEGQTVPYALTYNFDGDDRLLAQAKPALINAMLGSNFENDVELAFKRQ